MRGCAVMSRTRPGSSRRAVGRSSSRLPTQDTGRPLADELERRSPTYRMLCPLCTTARASARARWAARLGDHADANWFLRYRAVIASWLAPKHIVTTRTEHYGSGVPHESASRPAAVCSSARGRERPSRTEGRATLREKPGCGRRFILGSPGFYSRKRFMEVIAALTDEHISSLGRASASTVLRPGRGTSRRSLSEVSEHGLRDDGRGSRRRRRGRPLYEDEFRSAIANKLWAGARDLRGRAGLPALQGAGLVAAMSVAARLHAFMRDPRRTAPAPARRRAAAGHLTRASRRAT